MRIDSYMTPAEAAAWWRAQAAKDYHDREQRQNRKYRNRLSVKAILAYIEPKKRKVEIFQGDVCLPERYKRGGFVS